MFPVQQRVDIVVPALISWKVLIKMKLKIPNFQIFSLKLVDTYHIKIEIFKFENWPPPCLPVKSSVHAKTKMDFHVSLLRFL